MQIDCRWRWITLLFALSHFIVWFVFALMFYLSAYVNGDLSDNPGPILCITDGKTFTGIFGFSVETQVFFSKLYLCIFKFFIFQIS